MAHGEAKGVPRWNWDLIDELVATKMSEFVCADIPELTHDQADYWIDNYFLNSVFGTRFVSPFREYAFTFMRRTSAAFEEYSLARAATYRYVELRADDKQPLRAYRSALYHWEQCVASGWQAVEAWMRLSGERAYVENDGSVEQRFHHVYNRSKHTDSAIKSAQMPPRGPLAMWLANDGLTTIESVVTWLEMSEVLDELGKLAARLQRPESMRRGETTTDDEP